MKNTKNTSATTSLNILRPKISLDRLGPSPTMCVGSNCTPEQQFLTSQAIRSLIMSFSMLPSRAALPSNTELQYLSDRETGDPANMCIGFWPYARIFPEPLILCTRFIVAEKRDLASQ